jgi:hypothetical protein
MMMGYSQEVYDAASSKISRIDGSAIERVAREAFDISYAKAMLQEQIATVGYEMARPSVLYRPTISLDGNCYCALYGEDLMSGCAGFGETMAEAMADFDKNWSQQKAPHVRSQSNG